MKKDIQNRTDIEVLIKTFYEKLLQDKEMHYLFFDIVRIDLSEHLPILCDFWENLLFFTRNYSRDTMGMHLELNRKYPLQQKHFDTWLGFFCETVDELFIGNKATLAKTRAKSIAEIMQMKINQLKI